jgi:hypothetical protein
MYRAIKQTLTLNLNNEHAFEMKTKVWRGGRLRPEFGVCDLPRRSACSRVLITAVFINLYKQVRT